MFEHAVEEGVAAAATWTPEHSEPGGGGGCCPLCFGRYRMLVLDGPLRDLPHDVAHTAVTVVEETIRRLLDEDAGRRLRSAEARECMQEQAGRRSRAARGGLALAALEEFAAARSVWQLLRRRYTEPAILAYLAGDGTSPSEPWDQG